MAAQLNPEAQDLLDVMRAMDAAPIHTLSVETARQRMRVALIPKAVPQPLLSVEDVSLPAPGHDLRLRLYRPLAGILPVALFLHGGGWTVNDLDTHDDLCRRIAKRSGWLLASLDYRRAPEYKYPAALEDAYYGYRWLLDNSERIGCDTAFRAVVGESSGGTIAAATTLLLRDRGAPMPTYQIVAYPAMDRFGHWPSYKERGSGYILDRELLKWFFDHYLPVGVDPSDPYLFPLAAPDLSRLPPTLVMTAEFDPLRDEGNAYAKELVRAGVSVKHVHAGDLMHGFLLQGQAIGRARELIDFLGDTLASQYTRHPPVADGA